MHPRGCIQIPDIPRGVPRVPAVWVPYVQPWGRWKNRALTLSLALHLCPMTTRRGPVGPPLWARLGACVRYSRSPDVLSAKLQTWWPRISTLPRADKGSLEPPRTMGDKVEVPSRCISPNDCSSDQEYLAACDYVAANIVPNWPLRKLPGHSWGPRRTNFGTLSGVLQ